MKTEETGKAKARRITVKAVSGTCVLITVGAEQRTQFDGEAQWKIESFPVDKSMVPLLERGLKFKGHPDSRGIKKWTRELIKVFGEKSPIPFLLKDSFFFPAPFVIMEGQELERTEEVASLDAIATLAAAVAAIDPEHVEEAFQTAYYC